MSKHRDSAGMDFGLRVGVVVKRAGALLLVLHRKPGREPYWVLPGGRLEPGETIPECAARELLEETGLEGRFAGLLYVSEFMREGRHTVDVTVRMITEDQREAQLGGDPEVSGDAEPTLRELRWVAVEDLSDTVLLPPRVRTRLLRDAARGWPENEVYLGGGEN